MLDRRSMIVAGGSGFWVLGLSDATLAMSGPPAARRGNANPYAGIGQLHNLVMEKFGQTLLSVVKTGGAGAITADVERHAALYSFHHALEHASRHVPQLVGAKINAEDIERAIRAQRGPANDVNGFTKHFPASAVRDLESLKKMTKKLAGAEMPASFTAYLDALESRYASQAQDAPSQILLIGSAIARSSTRYWLDQVTSSDSWIEQLAHQPGGVQGGGGESFRIFDHIRAWLGGRDWGHIGEQDTEGGIEGGLGGVGGGVPTILLGGLLWSSVKSIGAALGWL